MPRGVGERVSDATDAVKSGANTIDTAQRPTIAHTVEMLQQMSKQTVPEKLLYTFGKHTYTMRRNDYLISLSRRGLRSGEYKITRSFVPRDVFEPDEPPVDMNPWRDWKTMPAHVGGFLGEAIADDEPKLYHGLSVRNDPVLGDSIGEFGSMMAVPAYDHGEALNWNFQFRREPGGHTLEELEQAVMTTNMLGTATRNLVAYTQAEELRSQLEGQFQQIASIQRSLLPRRLPTIPGLKIAASYLTSDQAGGDYYDFFEYPDGAWGVLIADVSGHGAAAATIMAILHTILHGYEGEKTDPAVILDYANRRLLRAGIEGSFVTAFFAIYKPATGEFHYARCGHNPPRLVRSGPPAKIVGVDKAGALPLGITDDIPFESARFSIDPGDALVLYTDGITEAFDSQREQFGTHRLDDAVLEGSGNPDLVVDAVFSGLYRHVGAMTRDDDQTLVVLQRELASDA